MVFVKREREKDVPRLTDLLCLVTLALKGPAESESFSVSLKKLMSANMLSESP